MDAGVVRERWKEDGRWGLCLAKLKMIGASRYLVWKPRKGKEWTGKPIEVDGRYGLLMVFLRSGA